jgi:hypothetical protein
MTLYEFNQLNHNDKVMFVWDNCTFLLNRLADETYTAVLYYRTARLYREEYFIEMCGAARRYNVNGNSIDSIVTFRAPRLLEPYLEKIPLEELE